MPDIIQYDPESDKMLANMDQASYALTQARSVAEIKHIHDIAEAAKRYAKAADLCNEAYIMASVVAADARRKAGEMLMQLERKQGERNDITSATRGGSSQYKEVLRDVSLGEQTARRWQQEARVPEAVYQEIKQEALEKGKEISQREVLKIVKQNEFKRKKDEFNKEITDVITDQIVIAGDCIQVMRNIDDNSFDLLLTDPPYGMDFKSGWNDNKKIVNDKIDDTILLFENMLSEAKRVLKNDAHFYIFGSIDYIQDIRPIIQKHLNLLNILIWDRQIIGMGDLRTYGKSYDIIYFGYNKVFKDLNGVRDRDVLNYNRTDPSKMIHPTEKPLDILEFLIKKSSNVNDHVLDPFAGGGSTLIACKNLARKATGIEIEDQYVNLINSRL